MRAGNNRSWARNWNANRTCYTRDEWYRVSQQVISGVVEARTTIAAAVEEQSASTAQAQEAIVGASREASRKAAAAHPIEQVGSELRAMMPWIGANKLVDKDKN